MELKQATPAQIRKAYEALREIERGYEFSATVARKASDIAPTEREIEHQLQAIREVMPSEF